NRYLGRTAEILCCRSCKGRISTIWRSESAPDYTTHGKLLLLPSLLVTLQNSRCPSSLSREMRRENRSEHKEE
ncbi:hypothetical protein PENTCL1PPCAC_9080, partial [Pristionchus entomophagus]